MEWQTDILHLLILELNLSWLAGELIISIVVKRPKKKNQHLCSDKGYDYDDVHEFVEQAPSSRGTAH